MKKWVLVFLILAPIVALATEHEESVCIEFHTALTALKHHKNDITSTSFEFNGKTYNGCEVVFETKWSLIGNGVYPQEMFYPAKENYWYHAGWRADDRYSADGPGSTSYVIRKGNVFCIISWYSIAYIDEKTGELVTGDDLSCRIQCAIDKNQRNDSDQPPQ